MISSFKFLSTHTKNENERKTEYMVRNGQVDADNNIILKRSEPPSCVLTTGNEHIWTKNGGVCRSQNQRS